MWNVTKLGKQAVSYPRSLQEQIHDINAKHLYWSVNAGAVSYDWKNNKTNTCEPLTFKK